MPHMPDSHHATHDLEIVAAFAAGDATGADLETATTLVASCAECAALHHDLRAIAAAMPALPVPVRSRDFRLTPDQAASLRPRGFRAVLAAFASPRLSFATPLGTGLAAIGIVGVLVASGGLPAGGATSGAAAEDANVRSLEAPAEMGAAAASAAPLTGLAAESTDPTTVLKAETDGAAATGPAEALPVPAASEGPEPLLVLGIVLVFTGSALIALRLVSRRLARAP
jgi:hypothetical protein